MCNDEWFVLGLRFTSAWDAKKNKDEFAKWFKCYYLLKLRSFFVLKYLIMEDLMKQWRANSTEKSKENFAYIQKLKMKSRNKVDSYAKQLHEEAFEYIDCLKCGNCCKVSQPVLSKADMKRIAEYLGISQAQLKEQYLVLGTFKK